MVERYNSLLADPEVDAIRRAERLVERHSASAAPAFNVSGAYTDDQRAWCKLYLRETGFTPMMDAFEAGNATFDEAATRSIRWYESHTSDVHLRIQRAMPLKTD